MFTWEDLDYWRSKEWGIVQRRLDHFDVNHKLYCPRRELMFAALDATPFEMVRVVFVGQDPYPNRNSACGLAFSIPNGTVPTGHQFPPTLDNMFKELVNDLHYNYSNKTDLITWAHRGVLLWNAIPSCGWSPRGRSNTLSHEWIEWVPLTTEILRRLSTKGKTVFVFLGGVAQRYAHVVDNKNNRVIKTSHPSPRSAIRTANPFMGSRLYSTVNKHLADLEVGPIDWKL